MADNYTDGGVRKRAVEVSTGVYSDVVTLAAGSASVGSVVPKWGPLSSVQALLSGDGTAPTLKNLSNAALVLSNEIDNRTNLYAWLNLVLLCRGASAFTSGGTLDFWIITALDGTTYADGGAAVTPARAPDGYFWLRAVATAQRIEFPQIQVPPCKFKVLVRNSGGQAMTATDGENVLTGYLN